MPGRDGPLAVVEITDHALARYRDRIGPISRRALWRAIVGRLTTGLRRGMRPDPSGALRVWLEPCVAAVVEPRAYGGWVVSTILGPVELATDVEEQSA